MISGEERKAYDDCYHYFFFIFLEMQTMFLAADAVRMLDHRHLTGFWVGYTGLLKDPKKQM